MIGSTAIARDVTELRAARDRAQLANDRLHERNVELQDFASVVSHDLRAPLRRVQMFADMALLAEPGDPELPDLLSRMRRSAARMEALVVDLVTYARIGSTSRPMAVLSLDDVVAEALEELQPRLLEASCIVDVGKLGPVEGDPVLLRQLFVNLVGNAVKFRNPDNPPRISVRANRSPYGNVEIEVADNGPGFEPEHAERIFGIFERLNPDGVEGTGVGLALCRKIVSAHSGKISATSTPGVGATFVVTLLVSQPVELLDAA